MFYLSPINNKTGLAILRHGQKLKIRLKNIYDIGSILETFSWKVYFPSFLNISDDGLIIDIGASIGDFSVLCASSLNARRREGGQVC